MVKVADEIYLVSGKDGVRHRKFYSNGAMTEEHFTPDKPSVLVSVLPKTGLVPEAQKIATGELCAMRQDGQETTTNVPGAIQPAGRIQSNARLADGIRPALEITFYNELGQRRIFARDGEKTGRVEPDNVNPDFLDRWFGVNSPEAKKNSCRGWCQAGVVVQE